MFTNKCFKGGNKVKLPALCSYLFWKMIAAIFFLFNNDWFYRLLLKKLVTRDAHSSALIPVIISVLGWKTL
jgi:hypothetical protein